MLVQISADNGIGAVFILELHANDVHAALGQLLDRTRVAGLRLTTINAYEEAGAYRIRASIDVGDREIIDKLARRISTFVGIGAIEVRRECKHGLPIPCITAP